MGGSDYDLLLYLRMIEVGIVPYDEYRLTDRSIDEGMLSLQPPDRRQTKRKFRKIWRQVYRRNGWTPGPNRKAEFNRRRMVVWQELNRQVEDPD
jgi:hypothetical protein